MPGETNGISSADNCYKEAVLSVLPLLRHCLQVFAILAKFMERQ